MANISTDPSNQFQGESFGSLQVYLNQIFRYHIPNSNLSELHSGWMGSNGRCIDCSDLWFIWYSVHTSYSTVYCRALDQQFYLESCCPISQSIRWISNMDAMLRGAYQWWILGVERSKMPCLRISYSKLKEILLSKCFKWKMIKSEIQIQTATYKLYIHECKHQSDRDHRDKYKITFQHPNLEIWLKM